MQIQLLGPDLGARRIYVTKEVGHIEKFAQSPKSATRVIALMQGDPTAILATHTHDELLDLQARLRKLGVVYEAIGPKDLKDKGVPFAVALDLPAVTVPEVSLRFVLRPS